jgi:hypothetical protein
MEADMFQTFQYVYAPEYAQSTLLANLQYCIQPLKVARNRNGNIQLHNFNSFSRLSSDIYFNRVLYVVVGILRSIRSVLKNPLL